MASIGVDPVAVAMNVTDTRQFVATAYESDGLPYPGAAFTWSGSNETVGTVNDTGFFTALSPGTTTITASNGGFSGDATVTVVTPAIQAAFTGTPVLGEAPLAVQFTDTSVGPGISAWAWDFENDGVIDDTTKNPSHTYPSTGTYSVNLTVVGIGGTSSLVKENFISVIDRQSVVAWGSMTNIFEPDIAEIGAGSTVGLGIRSNGSLVEWGGSYALPEGNDFVEVEGGQSNTFAALRQNGTIVTFGPFVYLTPPTESDFTAVAAGKAYFIGLRANGSLTAWGDPGSANGYGQLNAPVGNDFIAVSARNDHILALKSDGSIVAWGANTEGQCNVPEGNDFIAVSAGQQHSLALRANHTIVGWGASTTGGSSQPGTYDVIYAGYQNSFAIRDDGSLKGWGSNPQLSTPPAGNDYVDITSANFFAIALRDLTPGPDTLTAEFTAGPAFGYVPVTIHGVDHSTGHPYASAWAWDFNNDGIIDSTSQCDEFTYTQPGNYSVNFTVWNNETGSSLTKEHCITVASRPVVSVSPTGGTFATPPEVTLTATDAYSTVAGIYYTTDGTDPQTSGTKTLYTAPIAIGSTTTILRFKAVNTEGYWSELGLQNFVISGPLHLANTDMPKFQYDNNNTGRSPFTGPQTATLAWNYTLGKGIYGSPVIGADGTVFVGSFDNSLYAFNPNGTLKWNYATGNAIWGTPALDSDGTIYIGSNDKFFYALNPDGTMKWRYPTEYAIYSSSPAISPDGTIVFGEYGSNVYGLYPNGTQKWRFSDLLMTYSSPALGPDGTVYIGAEDNSHGTDTNVYALNPDGTLKWKYPTGGTVRPAPSIGPDGTVYVGNGRGDVYALNPDGTLKWKYAAGVWFDHSSVAIAEDGTLYVGNGGGDLFALNPDGTLKWTYDGLAGSIMSSPMIGGDGTIYFGCGRNITAVSPEGSLKWIYTAGDEVFSSATIASDGTLYIGSRDYNLYAFRDPEAVVTAEFSANVTIGMVPLTVGFTDLSANAPTSWAWDFENNGTVDRYPNRTRYTRTPPPGITPSGSMQRGPGVPTLRQRRITSASCPSPTPSRERQIPPPTLTAMALWRT